MGGCVFCHDCKEPFDPAIMKVIVIAGDPPFERCQFSVNICRTCLLRREHPDDGDPEDPT